MKKYISVFVAAILMAALVCGCAQSAPVGASAAENSDSADSSKSLSIVTTIFPEYDWVKEILGDNPNGAEVTMLLDNGVDLHSFQPTAADIVKISTCDMFVYVGGESDEWVEDALKEATNKDMVVIDLLEVLGDQVKEEEIVEGMEHEHEHEDGDEHEHEEGDEHEHEEGEDHEEADEHEHEHEHEEGEIEYDEHVWLSLSNAESLTKAIKDALVSLDSDNAAVYEANYEAYDQKLKALDEQYKQAVSGAQVKTLLFGDRFPFRYLTDDYGLSYYAAFVGCSAETEASFETVTFLAGKVDELSLKTILTIEKSDQKIANTIKENSTSKDQQILALDSMQSTTSEDVKNGASYLGIMQSNLEVLKTALAN